MSGIIGSPSGPPHRCEAHLRRGLQLAALFAVETGGIDEGEVTPIVSNGVCTFPGSIASTPSMRAAVTDGILLNEDGYSLQMIGNDNQLHLFDRVKLRRASWSPRV